MSSEIFKSAEVVWHKGHVQEKDRNKLLNQKSITIWLTGLSASGKSTLAFALERKLIEVGHLGYVLDGDNVRQGLNKDLDFSPQNRTENIRRISEVAHLMNDAGVVVMAAFISPSREDRDLARQIIGIDKFMEVYISTPIEACEARDPKGMYRRARLGQIEGFTGVDSLYEPPISPDMIIDSSLESFEEATYRLYLEVISRITLPA